MKAYFKVSLKSSLKSFCFEFQYPSLLKYPLFFHVLLLKLFRNKADVDIQTHLSILCFGREKNLNKFTPICIILCENISNLLQINFSRLREDFCWRQSKIVLRARISFPFLHVRFIENLHTTSLRKKRKDSSADLNISHIQVYLKRFFIFSLSLSLLADNIYTLKKKKKISGRLELYKYIPLYSISA